MREELERYRLQIESLESQFGPYHQSLLEPLERISAIRHEQGDYEGVADVQSRQLQLMRTTLGFEHLGLIPQLRSMIANQMLLANWEEISDQLEHIRHIQASSNNDDPEALLEAIDDQAFWYLSRAYLDEKEYRVRDFFKARGLYEEMEDLAVATYGEDSPEIIPLLYKQAYNNFQLVQFLNASDGIGSKSVDRLALEDGMSKLQDYGANVLDVDALFGIGANIPVVRKNSHNDDSRIGKPYLQDGYYLIARIENINKASADVEAEAMAKIYRADFQYLQNKGIGIRNYRDAIKLLVQAGVDEEKINTFFSRPAMIPVNKFFHRLDDALAYQQENSNQIEQFVDGQIHLGVFTAWSEALDSTPKPVSLAPRWQLDIAHSQAELSFSVNSRGNVSSVRVIESTPDERDVQRRARRALRDIQFRPAVINGRGKRVKDVHIIYRFIEE